MFAEVTHMMTRSLVLSKVILYIFMYRVGSHLQTIDSVREWGCVVRSHLLWWKFYRGNKCCWKSQHLIGHIGCVKEASHCLPWCFSLSFSEAVKNSELNSIWQLPIAVPCSVTAGNLRARIHACFLAKSKAEPEALFASLFPLFLFFSLVLKS